MIAGLRRRMAGPQVVYASLVDILMATIGIFLVVFALQDPDATPVTRVPAPVEALIHCETGPDGPVLSLITHRDGVETHSPVTAPGGLTAQVRTALPEGARLWAVLDAGCAVGPAMDSLREAERALRRMADDAPAHVIEIVPATSDGWAGILSRWRADR